CVPSPKPVKKRVGFLSLGVGKQIPALKAVSLALKDRLLRAQIPTDGIISAVKPTNPELPMLLLTIPQAARSLSCSPKMVRQMVADGSLEAVRLGRRRTRRFVCGLRMSRGS